MKDRKMEVSTGFLEDVVLLHGISFGQYFTSIAFGFELQELVKVNMESERNKEI